MREGERGREREREREREEEKLAVRNLEIGKDPSLQKCNKSLDGLFFFFFIGPFSAAPLFFFANVTYWEKWRACVCVSACACVYVCVRVQKKRRESEY